VSMRWQFMLVPAAIVTSAPAMAGAHYLTLKQAQELIFPGETFKSDFRSLSDEQMKQIFDASEVTVWNRKVRVWEVSNGGWFFLDQVHGKDDWVAYAVGINPDGSVKSIEILECWERYNQIRHPAWRAQFVGAKHGEFKGASRGRFIEDTEIQNITGTTLSAIHVAEGVRRVLATFALIIAPEQL